MLVAGGSSSMGGAAAGAADPLDVDGVASVDAGAAAVEGPAEIIRRP
jgi:hypothetical protein